MERFDYLHRRRIAELRKAALAGTESDRSRHEEQVRAYDKIIAVLQREDQDIARRSL